MIKSIKRMLGTVMIVILFFSICSCSASTKSNVTTNRISNNIRTKSRCVMVYNLTDKRVVYAKNANSKTYPSSLAKLAVISLAIDKTKNLDKKYATNKSDYNFVEKAGESYTEFFSVGEEASIRDYLYAMMYGSKADACMAVTRYLGDGNTQKGIAKINNEFKILGMKHCHLDSPIGNDTSVNTITCSDYKKLMIHAMKSPTFKKILTGKTYVIKSNNKRSNDTKIVSSVYKRVGDNSLIMGGKVGYTEKAQKCLVSYSKINGKEYIMISTEAKRSKANEYPNFSDAEQVYKYIKSAS